MTFLDTTAETFFAPAGRNSVEEIRRKRAMVQDLSAFNTVVDAVPTAMLVLNDKRQVVSANSVFLRTLHVELEGLLGNRPGEIVGCVHCGEGPDGCGTGRHCSACGAVGAILQSQLTGGQVSCECRITIDLLQASGALDCRITASGMRVHGEDMTLVAIENIASEKRLQILSRAFFHDVFNTVDAIRGCAVTLPGADEAFEDPATDDGIGHLLDLVDQLIDEIKCHRELTRAESNEMQIKVEPVDTSALLQSLVSRHLRHPVAKGRRIELAEPWHGRIETDRQLLSRVLTNMTINALEASQPGDTVTLDCVDCGDEVEFSVHNPGVMPEDVQLQIFQRSFSTKAKAGRGIGTHSMRLLGERYLKGEVSFTSTEAEGTTFRIAIPKRLS